MHDLPILVNITIALVAAFIGGATARRIGLPPIVGYLLAGILIGPFTPGFIGDIHTIQQLAELGVIFLMLGVGLHFSFEDLWKVRDIAIPGALFQTATATLIGFFITRAWGWSISSSILFGLAISVASTVVLLRGLMDNSLLNTSHGQAAVGWLVMEDILSVLILVVMPIIFSRETFSWTSLGVTVLKLASFGLLMFFLGKRFIPWLLEKIAHTRSRELFILAVLAISLGTALGAAAFFGVSLALGAFVAGAIISQSHLSHQVGADILPFRESFAVLFFVSVGMLVNPVFLWLNLWQVILISLLIIVGKFIITLLLGAIIRRPAITFLVVAVGVSQIGEFSFILGQEGLRLNLLSQDQYSLLLAGSLISITVNPLMYRLMPRLESWLRNIPFVWKQLDRQSIQPVALDEGTEGHVAIVGFGRVGTHMVNVLERLNIPQLVIDSDAQRIQELTRRSIPALYGDAANSEILQFARLEKARLLVVTLPDDAACASIISAAHHIKPELSIISRVSAVEAVDYLHSLGAREVIQPELEGGLEMIRHLLLGLDYPLSEVYQYTEAVRQDQYNIDINSAEESQTLRNLVNSAGTIGINWVRVEGNSGIIGRSLAEANIRALTGASVVALMRANQLTANPKSATLFEAGDRVGLIGEADQIAEAVRMITGFSEIPPESVEDWPLPDEFSPENP